MSPAPSTMSPPLNVRRTRSGQAINRAIQQLKPSPKPTNRALSPKPRPKKVKKEKIKIENRTSKLDEPLSILTRDWTHVPVVDIDAYVNRSAETRRQEVEEGKNPGKVKRPMNSFMLYRKAYQNRTKSWCLQNNHQIVSQVCGDSWPLEPENVRAQFNEWLESNGKITKMPTQGTSSHLQKLGRPRWRRGRRLCRTKNRVSRILIGRRAVAPGQGR